MHTGKSKKRGLCQTCFEDDENCKGDDDGHDDNDKKWSCDFCMGILSKLNIDIQFQSDISYKPQNICTPSESPE